MFRGFHGPFPRCQEHGWREKDVPPVLRGQQKILNGRGIHQHTVSAVERVANRRD